MKLVIGNQIIVTALGSEEIEKVSELCRFMSDNINATLAEIEDKIIDLDLSHEVYEEVQLVGARPTTLRH